ncbi:hypothetical protein YIM73518_16920 [Thermus brockianus]
MRGTQYLGYPGRDARPTGLDAFGRWGKSGESPALSRNGNRPPGRKPEYPLRGPTP